MDERLQNDARRTREGFTLIELLIVVALMALVVGGASMGFGALTRGRLRASAVKLVAASRYAYNRAATQGSTVRIRFDLDQNTFSVEEAHGQVTLVRSDDETRERLMEAGDGDSAAVDPWAAAEERLHDPIEPSFGASPFGPIRGPDGEVTARFGSQPVGDGIQIVRFISPHEAEPRDSGSASIYFFPHGMAEHSVVQLMDRSGSVYSVEVHALTGRGRVYDYAFEPTDIDDDGPRDES